MSISTSHIRHGLKVSLATTGAYLITLALDLPMGFWAALSAVIVMSYSVADSVQLCWYRLTGTGLGAAIGMLVIWAVPDGQLGAIIALAVTIAFCGYMTRYSPRYKMAAITLVVVLLASIGQPDRLHFALLRFVEIAIGVSCAFFVTILVWPERVGRALDSRLDEHLSVAADTFHFLVESFLNRQARVEPDLLNALDRDAARNRDMFHKVLEHEHRFFSDNLPTLSLRVETFDRTLWHMHAMIDILNEADCEGDEIIIEPEIRFLAQACEDAMRSLGRGKLGDPAPLAQAVERVDQRLLEIRAQGATLRFSLRKWLQVLAFMNTLHLMGQDLLVALTREDNQA